MAESTGIEWAHATWNPWQGCKKVSPGCAKCYMFREKTKYGQNPKSIQRSSNATFRSPLTWARTGKLQYGDRVFTCSWSDFFLKEADQWRDEAWEIIRATPFNYLILTKRPERIQNCLPQDWGEGYPNVWLGVSAENQIYYDIRVAELLRIPAAIHWVSAEPLLGPINLRMSQDQKDVVWRRAVAGLPYENERHRINWVVAGGESDLIKPRLPEPEWIRGLQKDCYWNHIPFYFKQWGGTKKIMQPEAGEDFLKKVTYRKTWGGRMLDGKTYDEFPDNPNLQIPRNTSAEGPESKDKD